MASLPQHPTKIKPADLKRPKFFWSGFVSRPENGYRHVCLDIHAAFGVSSDHTILSFRWQLNTERIDMDMGRPRDFITAAYACHATMDIDGHTTDAMRILGKVLKVCGSYWDSVTVVKLLRVLKALRIPRMVYASSDYTWIPRKYQAVSDRYLQALELVAA